MRKVFLFSLLSFFFGVASIYAQTPNNNPKNATGCVSQQLGGSGGAGPRSYWCFQCGSVPGCPASSPCPQCWLIVVDAENPHLKHITIYLEGNPRQYIGTNVDFNPIINENSEFIGWELNFEAIEEL